MAVVGHGPLVGGRRLRAELKRLREAANLTQDTVADEMDWSLSKLIRIEAGSVSISTNDLKALLDLYGIKDPAEVDGMLDLLRSARTKMWWNNYRGVMSKPLELFVASETETSVFKTYQLFIFPGLLQTEDYARDVIEHLTVGRPTDAMIQSYVELRMERQRQFFGRPEPVRFHVILDESVLRRAVGGKEVLRGQMQHLLDLNETRSELTVQILQPTVGVLPGMASSFTVMEFGDADDLPMLFIEGAKNYVTENIDAREEVDRYQAAFNRLGQRALSATESRALIRELMGEIS
jgi:transcriptional regulator with XRE-family HTH domain